MPAADDRRTTLGRFNLVDAAVGGFLLFLIPLAFATFLLFRTPKPQIESVTQVAVGREERRVAGGSSLSSKLKVRGSGLRPMLRATIDSTPALGFVFESPNSADVLVGPVPAGVHSLILWDGVQEVARADKSVVVQAVPAGEVRGVGTLLDMDRATAESLRPGARYPEDGQPLAQIVKLGPLVPAHHRMTDPHGGAVDVPVPDRWERAAVMMLRCDPDSGEGDCAVGGASLTTGPSVAPGAPEAIVYTRALTIPWPSPLRMTVDEILPPGAAETATVRVQLNGSGDILALVSIGDRDGLLDDRAATVTSVAAAAGDRRIATLTLGADRSREGWRYRGRLLRPGAPLSLSTPRYVVSGSILGVTVSDGAK